MIYRLKLNCCTFVQVILQIGHPILLIILYTLGGMYVSPFGLKEPSKVRAKKLVVSSYIP